MAKNKEKKTDDFAKKKSTIDMLSIIGVVLAVVVVAFGLIVSQDKDTGAWDINMEAPMLFFDVASLAIVLGGTITALMLSYPAKFFGQIPKHLKIIVMPVKYNPMETITQIVEFAKEARINGLLALEDKLENASDEFLKNSLMLVVDSVEPEKVKQLLETELDYLDERHAQARAFYSSGASYAPAFGMIGTLIGLIKMLAEMGSDASKIGPAMSVALITTFYGTILANVVFSPIANKLKTRHDEEYLCKMIISEGVQAIQAGDNPKFIEEKLVQLVPKIMVQKGMKAVAEMPENSEG